MRNQISKIDWLDLHVESHLNKNLQPLVEHRSVNNMRDKNWVIDNRPKGASKKTELININIILFKLHVRVLFYMYKCIVYAQ